MDLIGVGWLVAMAASAASAACENILWARRRCACEFGSQ